MAANVIWSGLHEFDAAVNKLVADMVLASRNGVRDATAELEKRAKQNSSGPPGPNVVSGTHRRGIITTPIVPYGLMGFKAEVGPTEIYSRRLELGFHGADSRGRVYNQAPRAYFEPAFGATPFEKIFTDHWAAVLR